MDPSVEEAQEKKEQADMIENTAADLRSNNNTQTAIELETTAQELRSDAQEEEVEAVARAEEEKQDIDEKYGTG